MGMPKLVFFFDGTGNGPCESNPSNVYKLYNAFEHRDDPDITSFYCAGPGATEFDTFAGKVAGSGIIDNIKKAYRDLARNYEGTSEIALFGFSRGAYTVHMLMWLLNKCGIPQDVSDCDTIVDRFINNPENPDIATFSMVPAPIIAFVGVWDIVKSVMPNRDFMDETIPCSVKRAYHAMALDELRKNFPVMKWKENGNTQLTQEWFAGVHSDIGGGYPLHGLSDIAYKWIQDAAMASGIVSDLILPDGFRECPDQELNNPFADDPKWIALGQCARKFEGETVHPSVFERHKLVAAYTPKASEWHWA